MRILICGNYGVSNVGDEIILDSLKKLLLKAFPGSLIEVMGQGRLFPFGIRSLIKAIFNPELLIEPYRLIKSCDLFVLGGGGLFTDEEGGFVSGFWALHVIIAHRLKKPVAIIGVSIESIKLWNNWLVKKAFRSANAVLVRDKSSKEFLGKWGIKCEETVDLAVLYKYVGEYTEPSRKYVVISFRPFVKTNDILYTKLAQFCNYIIEKYGLLIRLVPFQKQPCFDTQILTKIFVRIHKKSHVKIEPFHTDMTNLLNVLRDAEIVISMRLHAGILSVMAGTPFIPINYMQKVIDLWQEFPEIKPVEFSEEGFETLAARFDYILNNLRKHREIVRNVKHKLLEKAGYTEDKILNGIRSLIMQQK